MPILTDANGRPLSDRPTQPPVGAPIDDHIAWQRAVAAWDNDIRSRANRTFDRRFRATLRADDE